MTEDVLRVPSSVPEDERPEISLHLLVKNGESVVGRLLDCVGPYLTEVVAVLNDCEDGTGSVLVGKSAEHGLARCELVEVTSETHPELYLLDVPETYREGRFLVGEVLPGPFTGGPLLADFAAARNLGWDLCQGDWRLFLDADDVVDDPGCLPGLCAALGDRGVEAASTRYYHGLKSNGFRERLARDLPQVRWDGAVHERLVGFARAAHVEGSLVVRDLRDSRGKGTRPPGRNLKVLYHRARSLDWQITPREMVYLAAESRTVMPELAKALAESCLARSGWAEERAWACTIRGQAAEAEGDLRGSASWYRRSLGEHPGAGTALRLARVCFLGGDWEGVVRYHEEAVRLGGDLQFLDAGEVDADAVKILAAASLAELGRGEEALILCREARANYPESPTLVKLLDTIEKQVDGRR